MNRKILRTLLLLSTLSFVMASTALQMHAAEAQQAGAGETVAPEGGENEKPDFKWHLINTGLFAAGLGWAIWKFAPGFFSARSADIQRAIKEATGLKMEADLRYSEIDRKMATLPAEVDRLKAEARVEMEREHRRRQGDSARELKRIQDAGLAEIEAIRQDGVRQVRQRAARRALRLAERRLAQGVPASSNEGLLQDFIHLVERGKA